MTESSPEPIPTGIEVVADYAEFHGSLLDSLEARRKKLEANLADPQKANTPDMQAETRAVNDLTKILNELAGFTIAESRKAAGTFTPEGITEEPRIDQ